MRQLEALVVKIAAPNRVAAAPVATCEIAALDHEVGNYPMKDWVFVAIALRATGKFGKVFDSFWRITAEERDLNGAKDSVLVADFEVDQVYDLGLIYLCVKNI